MAGNPLPPASLKDEDNSRGIFVLNVVFIILPILSVAVRFWSRSLGHRKLDRTGHRFWWDDWAALASMIASTGCNACIFVMIKKGLGRHTAVINPSRNDLSIYLEALFAANFFFHTAIMLVRCSAVYFYQRVFDIGIRSFTVACQVINTLNWLNWVAALLSVILACNPVERFYKPWLPGTCTSQSILFVANSVPNCLLDLAVLILPLPKLWKVQIKLSNKILLCSLFLVGYAEIVLTIGVAVTGKQNEEGLVTDPMWNAVEPFLWIILNAPIAVICICLPSFALLVKLAKDSGPKSLLQIRASSVDRHMDNIQHVLGDRRGLVIIRSVATTVVADHADDVTIDLNDRSKQNPFTIPPSLVA